MKGSDLAKPLPPARKPGVFQLLGFAVASFLLFLAAAYTFYNAFALKSFLYDSVARQNSNTASTMFYLLEDSYNADLRALHLKVEAQDVHYEEIAGVMLKTAHINGFDSITTVIRRGGDYVNILDSRFSRQLDPNVDYNTVGSIYHPREEGGLRLEQLLSGLLNGEKPYGYAEVRTPDGKTVLICARILYDDAETPLGIVLVRYSSGLVSQLFSLLLPYGILIAVLLCAALILVWKYISALRARRAAIPDGQPPLTEDPAAQLPEPVEGLDKAGALSEKETQ